MTAVRQRLDDRYEVVRSIGAGGMTRVFEAWDRHERRRVAVKMPIRRFADDHAFVARLEREVTAVAGLAHPNVAGVHEVRWDGRAGFVVAELVDGSSLWEMLAARGALPPAGAAMVAAQACVALAAAHAGGLTHGHLTPANVLLCIDGRVKLTDFRLAQAAKPALVAPGPEDDLHALGRCLVVMLTGREQPPGEPVRLGPEVPGELATIVRRATGQRGGYASAADFGRDLVRFLAAVRPGLALPGQPAHAPGHDPGDLASEALSRAVELMWSLPATSPVRPPGAAGPAHGRPAADATGPPAGPGAGGGVPPARPAPPAGTRRATRAGGAGGPRGAPRPGAAGGRPPPAARAARHATQPPARRRRLALVAGLAGALLAVVAVVAVGLPRGGPNHPAASQTPAPPSSAFLPATAGEPATSASTTSSQAPTTTVPATTAARAKAPPPSSVGVPARRTVPSVVGLHRGQATDALQRAGLRVRVVEVRAGSGQVQRVVAQDPAAGEVVPAGSVVTVTVATKGR